ncbi:MAG: HAD family hydrolase [Lachnospiraceae bacterium]|nr:HAD family hydrolase [Lachnospiraceae bacterium]
MENIELIKAAVFDVDGTLYDYRTGRVLPSSITAARALRAKGCLIIVATGRTKVMLCRDVTESIAPDYYILSNGALIADQHDLCISSKTFSKKDTQLLVDLTGQYNGAMVLKYADRNCIYYDYDAGCRLWDVGPGMDAQCTYLDRERKTHKKRLPVGISIYGNTQLNCCIREYFPTDLFHDGNGFDVMRSGVHKMAALNLLLRKLRLRARNIIAFGDSTNDMEMICQAGIGVAMGNASDSLKETADYVADCSWDDGIAKTLRTLKLI